MAAKKEELLVRNQSITDCINAFLFMQTAREAFYHGNLEPYIKALSEYGMNFPKTVIDEIAASIQKVPAELIKDNPYFKRLRNQKASYKNWTLKTKTIRAGELFVLDDTTVSNEGKESTPLGYLDINVKVPLIEENGDIWMSIVPHEIVTMEHPIQAAKGRVLTYGLGMGYFALRAAEKEEVREVIVVEKESEPIEIFEQFIRPHFPYANKVKVIKDDAFHHAKTIKDGAFDTIFVDIWHNAFDGLRPYSRFLKSFQNFQKTRVDYWIEETIHTYLTRVLMILGLESEQNVPESAYLKAKNDDDLLINDVYFTLKNNGMPLMEHPTSDYLKEIFANLK